MAREQPQRNSWLLIWALVGAGLFYPCLTTIFVFLLGWNGQKILHNPLPIAILSLALMIGVLVILKGRYSQERPVRNIWELIWWLVGAGLFFPGFTIIFGLLARWNWHSILPVAFGGAFLSPVLIVGTFALLKEQYRFRR